MTHFWKIPLTLQGARCDFFTATDEEVLQRDLQSPTDTSFLRRDTDLMWKRGSQSLEDFCARQPLEAHALLAEAVLQGYLGLVHGIEEPCSVSEVDSFEESECDLVAEKGADFLLPIWRRNLG